MATRIGPVGESSVPRVRPGRCECRGAPLRTIRADRRFTLMDGMILVAASAVAFVLVRPILAGDLLRLPAWGRYLAILIAGLVTWTPTALYLKLRPPRPTWLRLSRQPDFVAGVAASSLLALCGLAIALLTLIRVVRSGAAARVRAGVGIRVAAPPPSDPYWWLGVVAHFGELIGPAVIAAWAVLVASGRHRPSRGWLDLLGRGLGIAWIVVFVVATCARLGHLRG